MLDWLFPVTCVLCGDECPTKRSICEDCLAGLTRVPRPICLYCGAPINGLHEDPTRCPDCKDKARPFLFARAALQANDQSIKLIHHLKYKHESHLAPALAPLLAEQWALNAQLHDYPNWGLVPVPVSPERLLERGYNQAEELAKELIKLRPELTLYTPLQRLKSEIKSQTKLTARQRANHALKIYQANPKYLKSQHNLPAHLLIIDDVFTTGSTARACARALRQIKGVEKVAVLTLLRVDKAAP